MVKRSELREHARLVLGTCDLLDQLHTSNIAHGDLTLHNAMWEETDKPVLIDLAASARLKGLSNSERKAKIDDDFSELYRDLVLAQFHVGALPEAHAQKSIQMIEELFPPEILPILSKLKNNDWSDEMP
jgi:serine/threonine protein kinase